MKKIINLNEDNIKEMVEESIKQILQEKYNMTSVEEIMEYMWLKPKITSLKVDIFVDDGQSYLLEMVMINLLMNLFHSCCQKSQSY